MWLQRTFSSFPSGWVGAALLMLRLVVGALATLEAGLMIARSHTPAHMVMIAAASLLIAGPALLIGFLTPIASVWICLVGAGLPLLYIPPEASLLLDSRMAAFEFVVMSAVLAVLGPGAMSVDARLFGRRRVAIRKGSQRSKL
jgi:putative oxidoreductase